MATESPDSVTEWLDSIFPQVVTKEELELKCAMALSTGLKESYFKSLGPSVIYTPLPRDTIINTILRAAQTTHNLTGYDRERLKWRKTITAELNNVKPEALSKFKLCIGFDYATLRIPAADSNEIKKIEISPRDREIQKKLDQPALVSINNFFRSSKYVENFASILRRVQPDNFPEQVISFEPKSAITKKSFRTELKKIKSPFELVIKKGDKSTAKKLRGFKVSPQVSRLVESGASVYRANDNENIRLIVRFNKHSMSTIVIFSKESLKVKLLEGLKDNSSESSKQVFEMIVKVIKSRKLFSSPRPVDLILQAAYKRMDFTTKQAKELTRETLGRFTDFIATVEVD